MKLEITTRNRKGGPETTDLTRGYVKVMTHAIYGSPIIVVDGYEGYGDTYKELENPEVRIYNERNEEGKGHELVFKGTLVDLIALIQDTKNMAEGINSDLEAGNIPTDIHELDYELYSKFAKKYNYGF